VEPRLGAEVTEETKVSWGGRFARAPDAGMIALTRSLPVDVRLLEHDVAATKAHARALVDAGLLEKSDVGAIDGVCDGIASEVSEDTEAALGSDEDVHSLVERLLTERLGDVGRRIHAGRSRNDLVATDLRLWSRDRAQELASLVTGVLDVVADLADEHAGTIMPGYTHLQRAQPVTLGFHLLAHGFALLRDGRRFRQAFEASNQSPLGAGALAGTSLPIDPLVAARELGFGGVFDNAMDAVSDRDFACDLAYACALCGMHLSRLAEEIVLWTSSEFGFARLSDEWSTGSSMMPQKRNPDLAELVRARACGGVGDLAGLLTLLKGLPLAYNRDLQEDKSFTFATVDRTASSLVGTRHLLLALSFDRTRLEEAAGQSGSWATDLAEELVRRGVPFREAHAAVGEMVARLEERGAGVARVDPDELASLHDAFRPEDARVADARRSVAARSGHGGPGPDSVRVQVAALRRGAELIGSEAPA
jgi:argininosuccinate lyase